MADFSTAPSTQGTSFELIPDGVLAKGWLTVEPFNAEHGHIETPPKDGGKAKNSYLKCRVTIIEGEFERRIVFHNIMRGPEEKALNMGNAQLRAILEYGNGWPTNPNWSKLGDYYEELWKGDNAGMPVAIKIGVEPAKDGYRAKNVVKLFLSPSPESDGHKDFLRLQKGDTGSTKPAAAAQAQSTSAPAWSKPAAPAAAQPKAATPAAPAAPAKPAWMAGGR